MSYVAVYLETPQQTRLSHARSLNASLKDRNSPPKFSHNSNLSPFSLLLMTQLGILLQALGPSSMDSQTKPTGSCAACGKASSSRCVGCTDTDNDNANAAATFYCSKACQAQHWLSHKDACHAAQLEKVATKKLFRAGKLLQDAFLATRSEAFDLSISKIVKAYSGRNDPMLLVYCVPKRQLPEVVLYGPAKIPTHPEYTSSVLSFLAGGDVFTGMIHELAKKAFEGQSAFTSVQSSQTDV